MQGEAHNYLMLGCIASLYAGRKRRVEGVISGMLSEDSCAQNGSELKDLLVLNISSCEILLRQTKIDVYGLVHVITHTQRNDIFAVYQRL